MKRHPFLLQGVALASAFLVFLPALSGCEGGSRGADGAWVVVDTLAGGTVQVRSGRVGAWGDESPWRLEAELVLGSATAQGPELFGNVAALAVDDEGRILVLDSQARELRIFDAEGVHLRTVGGRGSGPGEFQTPVGLDLAPDGRIWVVDSGNGRYTVLEPGGDFVTTWPRALGFMAWPWPTGFDARGRLHDVASPEEIVEVSGEGELLERHPVPTAEVETIRARNAQGNMVLAAVAPFRPRLQWRFDPGGTIWSGVSDRMRFVEQSLSGDTLRIVERDHDPVPVLPVEADSAETFLREMVAGSAGEGATVEGDFSSPPVKPAFVTFHRDDGGRLWVEPTRARGAPRTVEVFDGEGAFLGAISVEEGLELVTVRPIWRDGTLTALVTDEAGVPTVVRYRIRGMGGS